MTMMLSSMVMDLVLESGMMMGHMFGLIAVEVEYRMTTMMMMMDQCVLWAGGEKLWPKSTILLACGGGS